MKISRQLLGVALPGLGLILSALAHWAGSSLGVGLYYASVLDAGLL